MLSLSMPLMRAFMKALSVRIFTWPPV
jgi:hypothetical protein